MAEASGQFTLLLVDDNPTNLTLLAKIVEFDLPEVRVLSARSGREGLAIAARESIDGAFIDVQMPQMGGLEMCRALKSDPNTASIPLVLITAHTASPEMRAEGLEVGAYDFISQPISNVEMLARIKVMLRMAEGERLMRQDQQQLQQQVEDHSKRLRWISGLLLSGDGPLAEPDQELLRRLAAELPNPEQMTERQFIDKLTSEFPAPWRRTLMKLALLDAIPVALARRLSEITDIEAVLDYLQRHDLSLQPSLAGDGLVHFKAPIRELLRKRAENYLGAGEIEQVYRLAADWYQQQKDLVPALACLVRAQDYAAVSQLLSQEGLKMLSDGQQARVFMELAKIPEETAAGCGWLALFTGIAHLQQRAVEVDAWLELARNRFEFSADARGELLALSQQALQYALTDGQLQLGRQRLSRFRDLADRQLSLLDPFNRLKVQLSLGLAELYFAGSFGRVETILDQALPEAMQQQMTALQLELHLLRGQLATFQGRYRVARSSLERAWGCVQGSAQGLSVQALSMVTSELLFSCGALADYRRQRRLTEQMWGAEVLQKTVIGPFFSFFSSLALLAEGRLTESSELLETGLGAGPAACQPHLQSFLLQVRGWLAAQAGQKEASRADSRRALQLREQAGGPLAELANLLLAGASEVLLGDYPRAWTLLQQGLDASRELGEENYRGGYYAWLAVLQLRQGEKEAALDWAGQMLEILRRQQRNFFFALTPQILKELLALAAANPDWSEQVQKLAAEWLGGALLDDGRLLPILELQSLGGFRLKGGQQVLEIGELGQAPRLILAMLSSAPNQALSIELLMGALWPESSPTKARSSFDTAHSRLRKALEGCFGERVRQDYLLLDKGMLSLRHVRIDSLEFAGLVEMARYHQQRQNLWQAEMALWKAEACWQGEFLSGFDLDGDLLYRREQLTQLRLEQLALLAGRLRQREDHATAVRLLQSGLRLDPTQDSFVRELLQIYQQQGDKKRMRALVEDYRQALLAEDYDNEEVEEMIETLGPQRLFLDDLD